MRNPSTSDDSERSESRVELVQGAAERSADSGRRTRTPTSEQREKSFSRFSSRRLPVIAGAQKPQRICEYVRISSTAERRQATAREA